VRIEDIDPPREVPGAGDDILRTLEAFALEWDEPVVYQSQRTERYEEAIGHLAALGLAYHCSCTRKEIQAHNLGRLGRTTTVYPGLCRAGPLNSDRRRKAIRLRVSEQRIEFEDREAGPCRQDLAAECGDFALKRRDGLYAYQLAVVVDDAAQGITEVVRGRDLLDCTPGQILLQRQLGLPTPDYLHLPLVLTKDGEKLSKQTGAIALNTARAAQLLHRSLRFLGLPAPDELASSRPAEQLSWAAAHWRLRSGPDQQEATETPDPLESGP
jgi:glutamyl-Q tRNA(Asp) synthetase